MADKRGPKKSSPNRIAVGFDSDGDVIIEFYFGPKMIRIGIPPEDSARLRTKLAEAETALDSGGTTKQ